MHYTRPVEGVGEVGGLGEMGEIGEMEEIMVEIWGKDVVQL